MINSLFESLSPTHERWNLPLDTKIKIRLLNHPPKNVRPHTHTFFKVLLIR